ncbi:N-acyl-D-amino-acid deacylase family protein [Consotaella salsifontis]|uniref:Dihydroorotase/N-acyl-D-amino-acid deacylase n=1 Tax=Consotaella salsifontis TaxID=1365950 RepID=A0A1T4PPN3_9HYPH|nr:D-aminoacylase [Consotaella salsifontis]SJZ93207.1 dihydroorotase/N-acyl-D-amino-acid deacylase [Consotaella salsifontis]
MTTTLIRGARIIDGTGAPWYRGDVEIANGRIARIGSGLSPADGARVVDADERYLSPGFIDAHCHDDLSFLRERDRPEKAFQGVTTIVVGNCSFSLYPAVPGSREALRGHFSGLLGETADAEIFDDLSGYRAALEREGVALNLVSLVGHAALRLAVMGYDRRPASEAEIAAMSALLSEQMRQGAAGLSLGLVYPPSAFAGEEELVALGRVVGGFGGVVAAHIRSYEAGLMDAIEEFGRVLAISGAAGLLSHLQSAGRPNWGQVPKAAARLEEMRGEGIDISFDMYPYPAGSTWMLQLLPPSAMDGGLPALKGRLAQPEWRARLQHWIEHGGEAFEGQSKVFLIGWENVRLSAVGAADLKHLEGCDMRQAARRLSTSPFDLMLRLIDADAGQTGVILFQLDEDDLHAACCHRLYMAGSDGIPRPGSKPHPRAFGTFPRIAGRLRRESGWFPLEDAVRRMTSVAAQRFGLTDRGLVRPGMAADLVLFEDSIADEATFADSTVLASGVSELWVNGGAVIEAGRQSGARPGKVVGGHV